MVIGLEVLREAFKGYEEWMEEFKKFTVLSLYRTAEFKLSDND